MVATTIPVITEEDWARRFVENFPDPWTSEEAKEEGGALYALMFALGNAISNQMPGVEYDWKACRIETAVDDALDAVAKDFFGDVAGFPADVIRAPGEPDESLRARIQATLLLPSATRAAMIDMLKRLTGEDPRVMEPWRPYDTAVWNKQSFFNVDTQQNSARFGNPGRRGQGFIESPLPPFSKNQGTFPIYCFNKGACWNGPSSYFFRPQATWWMQIARLDALVNKTKVFGTKVWRKYTSQALTKTTLGGTSFMSGDEPDLTVEVFPAFAGSYVVLANCDWNTVVSYRVLANNRFVLVFSTPAPPGGRVDWVATPITVGGVGRGGIGFEATQSQIGILPAFQDRVLLVSPTWNTNVWLHSRSSSLATLKFSTPAPASSQLAYQFFPPNLSGSYIVPANSIGALIPISSRDPFQAFVLPTWNTSVDVDKSPSNLSLTFGTPPAEDSYVYFGLHES